MEIIIDLSEEEVGDAIKLYIREMILGSASPLMVHEVHRKDRYSDKFTATLVKTEKENSDG